MSLGPPGSVGLRRHALTIFPQTRFLKLLLVPPLAFVMMDALSGAVLVLSRAWLLRPLNFIKGLGVRLAPMVMPLTRWLELCMALVVTMFRFLT